MSFLGSYTDFAVLLHLADSESLCQYTDSVFFIIIFWGINLVSTTIKNIDRHSYLIAIQVRNTACLDLYGEFYKVSQEILNRCSPLGKDGLEQLGFEDTKNIVFEKSELVNTYLSNTISKFNDFDSTFVEVKAEEVFKDHFINFVVNLIKLEELLRNFIIKNNEHLNNLGPQIAQSTEGQEYYGKIFNTLLDDLNNINSQIISLFEGILTNSNIINNEINTRIINLKSNENINFENRFREQTEVIIKGLDHEIRNLTDSFRNQIKNLKLDQDATAQSNTLLKNDVESGLRKLIDLNEKTQKIEIEFSKIIKTESERIKNEIQFTKNDIEREIKLAKSGIENEVNIIIEKIKNQSNAIKLVYADHIKMAEHAALHELTNEYRTKALKESKEYKRFRLFTSCAIISAIIATLIIFAIPLLKGISDSNAEINYLLLTSRLTISLMFFVLAVYLSRQSAKHYECYQENDRTSLQLSALEPFIARMTDDEKKEIRKGLIPSYFNQANDGKYASKSELMDIPPNITSIINNVLSSKKDESTPS